MRGQDERDEVQAEQAVALAGIRDELAQLRRARAEEEPPRDNARPLHRMFGGEAGSILLLRSIPGFAGLWAAEIPDRFLLSVYDRQGTRWTVVLCTCGDQVALRPGALGECSCARWMLHAGSSVRFRDFAAEAA